MAQYQADSLQQRLYRIFEDGTDSFVPNAVRATLIFLVFLSTVVSVSASVPAVFERFGWLLRWFDLSVGAVFTIEYALRLWIAPVHPPWRRLSAWQARRIWMRTPVAILDFLAIIPFYLSIFNGISLHAFIVLRLLRFLKLVRYSAGLTSLADALRQERHALLGCLVILLGLVLMSASAMYSAEGALQPEKFGSIPTAMYWAVITLTTVGYGDATPITGLGRIISAITAVGGLVMLALPAGIIASAFSMEVHKRDFVVSWGMISSMPLFSGLDASELSAIMRKVRSRSFEAGEEIVHRDDPMEYMYMVVSGRLKAVFGHHSAEFVEGNYFGESGVLSENRWRGSVRAITRCKLMLLDVDDIRQLMDRLPEMAEAIKREASRRAELLESDPE